MWLCCNTSNDAWLIRLGGTYFFNTQYADGRISYRKYKNIVCRMKHKGCELQKTWS